jgi:hypothetical protein
MTHHVLAFGGSAVGCRMYGYLDEHDDDLLMWEVSGDGVLTEGGSVACGPYAPLLPYASAVVAADGSVVVVGAFEGGVPTDAVLRGNVHTPLAPLGRVPSHVSYSAIVETSRGFRVLGGVTWDAENEEPSGTLSDAHTHVVDDGTSLTVGVPLPKCEHAMVFGADGVLYVGGGDTLEGDSATAWSHLTSYAAERDEWAVVLGSTNKAYTGGAMVAYGRFIVCAGGVPRLDAVSKQVVFYDTVFRTFHDFDDLEHARHTPKIAVVGPAGQSILVVAGGGYDSELIPLPWGTVKLWTPSMHHPLSFHAVVTVLLRVFARSNVLNDDCVLLVISFLGCCHSIGPGYADHFSLFA